MLMGEKTILNLYVLDWTLFSVKHGSETNNKEPIRGSRNLGCEIKRQDCWR
jgi:hypothetical protein